MQLRSALNVLSSRISGGLKTLARSNGQAAAVVGIRVAFALSILSELELEDREKAKLRQRIQSWQRQLEGDNAHPDLRQTLLSLVLELDGHLARRH